MNRWIVVIFFFFLFTGCTSTGGLTSVDSEECYNVAARVENNEAKSGDDLYQDCIKKKTNQLEGKKGFWENTIDEFIYVVFDIIFT